MGKNVIDGKKLNTSYVPNLAGSTSCLSGNHMCAWLSVLSMYEKKDILTHHLLINHVAKKLKKIIFLKICVFSKIRKEYILNIS